MIELYCWLRKFLPAAAVDNSNYLWIGTYGSYSNLFCYCLWTHGSTFLDLIYGDICKYLFDYFTRFNLYSMSNVYCFTVLLLLRKQFILMLIDTIMILTNTINQTNKQIMNQNLWIPVMNLTYGSILIKVLRIIIIFLSWGVLEAD